MGEFREHLNLEVNPVSNDRFEILAITAGVANGWEFPAEVLRESLTLWEGVNCFVDHSLSARSVRDIAGVLRETRWDEAASGVRAELTAFGPSAQVLTEIGRQVLEANDEPAVRVGFSADVLFKGKAGKVEKILKIYSVDLVYNPARGGIFLRALNQLGIEPLQIGGKNMQSNQNNDLNASTLEVIDEQPASASRELQEQLSEMRAMRSEMSAFLLEGALANTRLPVGMQQRIRNQFQDRTFAPAELKAALREAHTLLGEFEGAKSVQGPARIEGMVEPGERLSSANMGFIMSFQSKKITTYPALPRLNTNHLEITIDAVAYDYYTDYDFFAFTTDVERSDYLNNTGQIFTSKTVQKTGYKIVFYYLETQANLLKYHLEQAKPENIAFNTSIVPIEFAKCTNTMLAEGLYKCEVELITSVNLNYNV